MFFVGCSGSEKPPIDIEVTFSKYGHGLYWISIISNVDSIAILSAKINRGNCDYWIDIISNVDSIAILSAKINRGNCANNEGFPYFKINKTLKFGDSYQFYILRCQHIKEVSIKTDKGTWNFGK
ncbi:hypothetical protein C2R76_03595 [Helicobacter pylori]|uniref:hypothetical protein n=1 Tax=Helicobacter pylori TaxID=210 RepID=UPI000D335706|nr:hypothetical protein [Helicobacter pylori]PUD68717.1 hypothetical protein C2R76_03595 [Helicobacter pylori]